MTTRFDGLLVDHAALEQAHHDIRAAVTAIDERLDRLETELAPLQSDWTGQAKDAYRVSKARWDTAITQMKSLLDDVGTGVARANADYAEADSAAAAGFAQI